MLEVNKTMDSIDEEIVSKAYEIMKNGDPVNEIMTEFHEHHVSDDKYGRLLMLAIASQHVRNTHGIHLTISGHSGKGKSHAGKSMLHMVPHEWWIESSFSPKALYYADNIKPCTIIFSDDVLISKEIASIIRRCITNFTKPQKHPTNVVDKHGVVRTIPERIMWIVDSVEKFMDEQTRNQMIDIAADESRETDYFVYEKQIEKGMTGAADFPESDHVRLCREIFRIIKNLEPTKVVIPFADNIDWQNNINQKNFDVLMEFVKAYALIRHLQRGRIEGGAIIANGDDFYAGKELLENIPSLK